MRKKFFFRMILWGIQATALLAALCVQKAIAASPIPQIASPLTAGGIVNQPFSYQILATYYPTVFVVTGLPSGLGSNATGLISGTPSSAGTFPVTLQVTAGTITTTTLMTIIIDPAAAPPPPSCSGTAAN